MLKLPQTTEINRALPKTVLYERFKLRSGQQAHFDEDISRMVLVNCIDAETVPALQVGQKVSSIYVLQVMLKRKNYDPKNIEMLFKLIPQRMVLALQHGVEVQLATFEGLLVTSPWQNGEAAKLTLRGIDLDDVWSDMVAQVGNVVVEEGKTVREQLEDNARHDALQKKIEALEKKARAERQPHRKMELFEEIQRLKRTQV